MLYTFKSPATGNLIMLPQHGGRLLRIIGKEDTGSGIVLPAEMPAALAALEAAIAADEARRKNEEAMARAAGEEVPESAEVTLRQRVRPFMDMLRRCHAADEHIVWGV